ncbi:MAG: winged helix-turn-helix transcriptional regulator [Mycobacterium sp.]|jgi:DNA-binding HxlR family transcriptional regulator
MTARTVTVSDNCATTFTATGPRVAAGDSAECHIVREVLSQLGDKWTLLVILCLSAGPLRFNALQRAVVGISHRMLTVTLRKLERDGLLLRTVHAEVPPHTEYALTALGVSFTEPVMAIANWAVAARPQIELNREHFERATSFD